MEHDDSDAPQTPPQSSPPAQSSSSYSSAQAQAATIQAILAPFLLQRQSAGLGGLRTMTLEELNQLLRAASEVPDDEPEAELTEEDTEDEQDEREYQRTLRQSSHRAYFKPVTEPQPAGVQLIESGEFGRVGPKMKARRNALNIAATLRSREARARPRVYKEAYTSTLVPNCNGTTVAQFDSNVYTGQYSADSSFFYTCSQDFRLNLFDTTVPAEPRRPNMPIRAFTPGVKTTMKINNTIQASPGRWTISDVNLSPDNERMVYASLSSTCHVTSTTDPDPQQIPIPFADPPGTARPRTVDHWAYDAGGYRIYSCRFSADGQEIIAGGTGQIFVYDLLANRRAVKIEAHRDDVNSCCWADTSSGNVLVSASDDTYLKVWDRRSLGASQKPSGVLMGHTEGITYVSAKGDGRYVISNGKDQKLRLWDLRKMRTNEDLQNERGKYYGTNFDYRYPHYPKPRFDAHPKDCSVMSYYGHSVLRTLIRCHFSPADTTGGQYIYSGSSDGKIHIWSLDGRIVQVLDRSKTFPMSFDPSGEEPGVPRGVDLDACVRDVSWHSQEPVLMSAAWEGGRGGSRVARHEWKGLSKLGGSLEDWVEREQAHAAESSGEGPRRSMRLSHVNLRRSMGAGAGMTMPGSYMPMSDGEDDEDDDEDWDP
ncbi:WD-REPEATS-REGION domain-containing protein [Mycena kentingensis (nom. inval.)]|nr:WD-REPEATS-REGION domain-containing protein [Mycena kentingensis (nom. inval.)]